MRERLEGLDLARGAAIALMFAYHFSYDLDYFGFISQNFNESPFWLSFRVLIVSLFIGVSGISLYLAHRNGINARRVKRRLLLLVAYAGLVSLATWFVFGESMVFFGILHFIAVASVLGLVFLRLGVANLFLGIGLIVLGSMVNHPFFDQPFLQWLGLMTYLPVTVDYVPLLPWFGVYLLGIYAGQTIAGLSRTGQVWAWRNRSRAGFALRYAGRHSLHIYILHQPIFIAILAAVAYFLA